MSRRAPTCTGLRALAVLLASVACLAGPPALAGWQSLGAFQPPAREGDALVFHGPQGTLSIAPAGEGVVRVRFVPGGVLPRDRSFAVVGRPGGGLPPVFTVGAEASTVASGALRATIRHAPLRISFESGNSSLDADDADRGIAFTGESIRVAKRLRDDEHVYGLGEKTGPLDKRGNKLGGVSYAMWNSDTYGYDDARTRSTHRSLSSSSSGRGGHTASSSTTLGEPPSTSGRRRRSSALRQNHRRLGELDGPLRSSVLERVGRPYGQRTRHCASRQPDLRSFQSMSACEVEPLRLRRGAGRLIGALIAMVGPTVGPKLAPALRPRSPTPIAGLLSPELNLPSSACLAVEGKSGPVLWLRGLPVQARLVALRRSSIRPPVHHGRRRLVRCACV